MAGRKTVLIDSILVHNTPKCGDVSGQFEWAATSCMVNLKQSYLKEVCVLIPV